MGKWTLEDLSGKFNALNTTSNFGHNFNAYYRMQYKPSLLDSFAEPPRLDWHEKVIKADHVALEWHEYELNMYALKPQSNTLMVWSRRYIEAYVAAMGLPSASLTMKGSSRLLTKDGEPVAAAGLPANLTDGQDQANAVRSYLKKHGGILLIEIHDIPSLSLPLSPGAKTERLLIFDCGIEGGEKRLKAEQYLRVDQTQPPNTWTQSFIWDRGHTWASRGLKKVDPPANLVTPVAPLFSGGEIW